MPDNNDAKNTSGNSDEIPFDANAVKSVVTPIITSAATTALVSLAFSALKELMATNRRVDTLAGTTEMHPVKEDASLSKNEQSAASTESNGAKDSVSGQNGNVKGAQTDAKASDNEATASEAGAAASRTKAGASDIETKAMKMM